MPHFMIWRGNMSQHDLGQALDGKPHDRIGCGEGASLKGISAARLNTPATDLA